MDIKVKEIREYISKQRHSVRTQAERHKMLYAEFKKRCIEDGVSIVKGLEKAMRMYINR